MNRRTGVLIMYFYIFLFFCLFCFCFPLLCCCLVRNNSAPFGAELMNFEMCLPNIKFFVVVFVLRKAQLNCLLQTGDLYCSSLRNFN